MEHSFAFEINNCTGESVTKKPNALLVDCGATTHIINDESKFSNFDDKFAPEKHYIELADEHDLTMWHSREEMLK